MKKKIFLSIALLIVAVGGLFFWSTRISNIWNAQTVGDIPTPVGFTRVDAPAGSFAAFVRALPLKARGTKMQYYTGGNARAQFLNAAVVDMPILSNWEQCADVTMHLRAEYLWRQGCYSQIRFIDVNGKRLHYSGGSSHSALESYLKNVYGMCSTFSVSRETTVREIKDVQPGDVLVYPARPGHQYGHAILVADVAVNSSGQKAILCIEGNTPAREMHVVRTLNPFHSAWTILDDDDKHIQVGAFFFTKDNLRHY